MPRIAAFSKALSIWVYRNDHAPPHFHVRTPDTDVLVNIRTFEILVGTYRRADLVLALEWARNPDNQKLLLENGASIMSADDDGDVVTVGTPFPKIKDVSAIVSRDHYVLVTWEDDDKPAVVDLAPALHAFKDYAPLRDNRDLFESVHVVDPWTIGWGADGVLDMHVSELERLSAEQMEKFDFASFLREMELTWENAALLLGISRRTVAYYAKSREIPRIAALACRYLQERRPVERGKRDKPSPGETRTRRIARV